MRNLRILWALVLWPMVAGATYTTNYVRVSSAGLANGIDWSNPLQWSTFTAARPATGTTNIYYVDNGTFAGKTFSTANNGTGRIWIKKATVEDHGTATGWVNTMGDGTNIFGALVTQSGYWTIDGNRMTNAFRDPCITNTAPQGIRINVSNGGTGIDVQGASTGNQFIDIHIKGPGYRSTTVETDGILLTHGGNPVITSCLVRGCQITDMDTLLKVNSMTNSVIEYCTLFRCSSADLPHVHPDVIYGYPCTDLTFRYNFVGDTDAETIFLEYDGHDNWKIYGNVFVRGSGSAGNCIQLKQAQVWGNFYVYNNVFVDWSVWPRGTSGSGKSFNMTNNIFINAGWDRQGDTQTVNSDYNGFSGTKSSGEGSHSTQNNSPSPFVNISALNYRLTAGSWPIDDGKQMVSPYNVDAAGSTFDSVPDVGAYQYAAAASDPVITVQPAGATVNIGDSPAFTVTASGTATLHYYWTFNGSAVGTDSSSYTRSSVIAGDNLGSVAVLVSNQISSVSSSAATLNVLTNAAIGLLGTNLLNFGIMATNTTADMTFGVSNAGVGTLSGVASISAPWSIVSGGTYSLAAGASQIVTVRFNPTARNWFTNGSVALTGGGGTNVTVSGRAYWVLPLPGMGMTNWVQNGIFSNATDLSFYATIDTSGGSGQYLLGAFAIAGFNLAGSTTVTMTGTLQATNPQNNSLWVDIDTFPDEVNSICDITNYTSSTLASRPVTWRGPSGTFDTPGFSPKTWSLGAGNHYIYVLSREPNMLLHDFTVLTAPALTSATIPAAGNVINLLFNQAVSIGAGGNGGWAFTMSGGAVTATYSSGSGSSTLVYSLSRTVGSAETKTVGLNYTQPGNGVEDAGGNDLASISGATVVNSSTVDTVAPTLSSATIPAAGNVINLLFSEAVSIGGGGNGGWAFTMSGGAVTATYASGSGTSALVYSLSRTVYSGETKTVGLNYTQPGNGVEDGSGNDLATISGGTVVNNSTQSAAAGGPVAAATMGVSGGTLRVTGGTLRIQ